MRWLSFFHQLSGLEPAVASLKFPLNTINIQHLAGTTKAPQAVRGPRV
jgi:hypothetical protein